MFLLPFYQMHVQKYLIQKQNGNTRLLQTQLCVLPLPEMFPREGVTQTGTSQQPYPGPP